mgnify:FL=1
MVICLGPWTISCGKALPFHASTRSRLKNMGQSKETGKNVVGMKCRAQIVKNRLGPPLRHADYDMYFDSGIDNYGGWLNVMKEHKLVKVGGSWYTLEDHNGEEIKFQSKDWEEIISTNDELREHIYQLICEKAILKYKEKRGIDDVEFTDEVIGD